MSKYVILRSVARGIICINVAYIASVTMTGLKQAIPITGVIVYYIVSALADELQEKQ